ncbi:MAG: polysaccharide deacetylase family protein [Candidatus Dormibacteria bacterium]
MLRRLVRARPPRGPLGDILNQLSLLAVVSMSCAIILLAGTHLGRHFGVLRGNPLLVLVHPLDPNRGLDLASKSESGLVPPSSGPPVSPEPPPPTVFGRPDQVLVAPPMPAPGDLRRPLRGGTWLPIVMYHYIREVSQADRVGWSLSVSPGEFRKQVNWLSQHGYTTITMRDASLILAGQKRAPERPVALTFDDGYRDFYTNAAPILRSAGFTATNYIPTALVGGSNYMSWSEIEDLDAEGFEMGAHSQFHTDVSKVSVERARVEILGSKADLESHLGHPVVDWAYPYGGYNLATIGLLRDAGFWSATTTEPGSWHDARHLLYLTRVRMGGTAQLNSLVNGVSEPVDITPAPAANAATGDGSGASPATSPRAAG